MIKWVKFYYSGTGEVKTLHLNDAVFQDNKQKFAFNDVKEMLSKSTEETANFWNGLYVGRGLLKA